VAGRGWKVGGLTAGQVVGNRGGGGRRQSFRIRVAGSEGCSIAFGYRSGGRGGGGSAAAEGEAAC